MIAKTLKVQGITPASASGAFSQVCQDILASETSRVGSKTNQDRVKQVVKELVAKELGRGKTVKVRRQTEKDAAAIGSAESKREKKESESLAGVPG
jgi:DUF917 family protein